MVRTHSTWNECIKWEWCFQSKYCIYGFTPNPVTVTIRIITFSVADPYPPSVSTVAGLGVVPIYVCILCLCIYEYSRWVHEKIQIQRSFFSSCPFLSSSFLVPWRCSNCDNIHITWYTQIKHTYIRWIYEMHIVHGFIIFCETQSWFVHHLSLQSPSHVQSAIATIYPAKKERLILNMGMVR